MRPAEPVLGMPRILGIEGLSKRVVGVWRDSHVDTEEQVKSTKEEVQVWQGMRHVEGQE